MKRVIFTILFLLFSANNLGTAGVELTAPGLELGLPAVEVKSPAAYVSQGLYPIGLPVDGVSLGDEIDAVMMQEALNYRAAFQNKYESAAEIKDKYRLEGLSLVIPAPDENGMSVSVGKRDSAQFEPELILGKWEGEVKIKVRPLFGSLALEEKNLLFENEKIILDTPETAYRFYELEQSPEYPAERAYELDVLLKQKPASNIIQMSLESENLKFYYQPALNQVYKVGDRFRERGIGEVSETEIRDKNGEIINSRPENIVGSYAVYHASKRDHILGQKNYKTGKAFHIYRPKIIDADNNWVWGELHIDLEKGLLTVTVPQDFLDRAAYPVVVDPTFGEIGIGGTTYDATQSDELAGQAGTPSSSGEVVSVHVYTRRISAGTTNWKGVIVLASSENIITNGVGASVAMNSTTAQWWVSTYSTQPSVTASTAYYACWVYDDLVRFYYDSGVANENLVDTSNSYASPTNPTDATYAAYELSYYATYELPATLEQEGFRFRDDNGSETTADWLEDQDDNATRALDTNVRLRVLVNATNNPDSTQYQLEYKKSTDSTYQAVPTSNPTAPRLNTQYDTATITAGNTSVDATLDTNISDLSRAFLLMWSSGDSGAAHARNHQATGYLWNDSGTTKIKFERDEGTDDCQVAYFVVETLNEDFEVFRDTATITATNNTVDDAIGDTINQSRSMVILNSRSSDMGTDVYGGYATGKFKDNSNLTFDRGTTIDICTIRWEVVEWSAASGVTVQNFEKSLSGDMSSGVTAEPPEFTAVTAAQTWLYTTFRHESNGLEQTAIRADLTDGSTITFDRYDQTTSYQSYARVWLVEFNTSDVSVQHLTDEGGSDDSTEDTGCSSVTLANSWVDATYNCNGTGTLFPRGRWNPQFTSQTNVQSTRYYINQASQMAIQAIDSSSWTYTQSSPILMAASGNIAASGANTTAQLTAPSGKTTGDFVTGRIQDDENPADAVDITSNDYTGLEWCIKATSPAAIDDIYQFHVTANGTDLDTYTLTPQLTIGDSTPPTVSTRETADLDDDGYIDALHITFDENILDSTVQASDFTVSGADGSEDFSSTTNGDTADDDDIYITFTDGVQHSGITPTLSYTKSGSTDVTDAYDNELANFSGAATTDTAAPVGWTYETADIDTDGYIDAIHITFSESIEDDSVTANDFDVSDITGEAFSSTTNGDTADDADIYITFTDGSLDTAQTPTITYTTDEPTDNDIEDKAATPNELADIGGGISSSHSPSWWNASWLNRRKITFNNANQSSNITSFPVLIKLDSSRIDYSKTQNSGEDIRFIDSNGSTELSYEIERWNESGDSIAWVKVPQIDASSVTDHIWMYYNNTGASDNQYATDVWSHGYAAVWHLKETSTPVVDSTENGINGTISGPTSTTGKMGLGMNYTDGDVDDITVTSSSLFDFSNSSYAASLWVNANASQPDWAGLIVKGSGDGPDWGFQRSSSTTNMNVEHGSDSASLTDGFNIMGAGWKHVTLVYNETTVTCYIDGLVVAGPTAIDPPTYNADRPIHFGNERNASNAIVGIIDEVCISNVLRSADWVAVDYLSTSDTLNSYGGEEDYTIAEPAWWNASWLARRKVFLDNSAQTDNLTNFPVLVALTSDEVDYSKTQNSGEDIRFVDSDGETALDYEIEQWNESGTSYVWVEVPIIDASSSTDNIWMYYNNTGASDGQYITDTWNTNYKGVWHLAEDPSITTDGDCGGGTKEVCDASTNNNDCDMGGVMLTGDLVAAKIGNGLDFDGNNDYLAASDHSSLDITGAVTLSAWLNRNETSNAMDIINKGDDGVGELNYGLSYYDDELYFMFTNPDDTYHLMKTSGASISSGVWYHLAATYNDTANNINLYVNGVLQGETIDTGNPETTSIEINNRSCFLGWDSASSGEQTNGIIDELRIINDDMTAQWIAADYRSTSRSFVTVSSEQTYSDVTTTDKAGPVIMTATTVDSDNDGQIDRVEITVSESVDDSTASGSGGYDVTGYASDAFLAYGTADDTVFRVTFTEAASVDSGATPNITVSSASLEDLVSNTAPGQSFTATTDAAKPVLLSATANVAAGQTIFNAAGERLDLVFSETISSAPSEVNLEAALTFAGGATDTDNIPSTGAGANPIALATTTSSNDTIRITFNTGNTANANLINPGTHNVKVGVGTNITDSATNTANTAPAAVTITAGAPYIPRPPGAVGYPGIY